MIVVTLRHEPQATWADFHATAARLGVDVSRAAVEERFAAGQPLVDSFREALERVLRRSVIGDPSPVELLQPFTAVLVGDATTIAPPDELADHFPDCGGTAGTSRAALELQALWDPKTGPLVERMERELLSKVSSPDRTNATLRILSCQPPLGARRKPRRTITKTVRSASASVPRAGSPQEPRPARPSGPQSPDRSGRRSAAASGPSLTASAATKSPTTWKDEHPYPEVIYEAE